MLQDQSLRSTSVMFVLRKPNASAACGSQAAHRKIPASMRKSSPRMPEPDANCATSLNPAKVRKVVGCAGGGNYPQNTCARSGLGKVGTVARWDCRCASPTTYCLFARRAFHGGERFVTWANQKPEEAVIYQSRACLEC